MAELKYPNLFSPLTMRGKTFKNRILVAPMGLREDGEPGMMSETGINFYEMIAAGGCARVCTGENDVQFGSAVTSMYWFFTETLSDKLKENIGRYVDACHIHGALAFAHFGHMGLYARDYKSLPPEMMEMMKQMSGTPLRANGEPYTHSDVYGPVEMVMSEPWDGVTSQKLNMDSSDGKHVHAMTEEKMNEIADAFAHCAVHAKATGLDGMIIHSGHGFIFSQWVSRRFNKRTDKYGGSMENRARFPIMCLKRIRDAVGEDFIVEMRFSAEEDISPITGRQFIEDVVNINDTVAFFKELDKYPGLLDIAHITGGLHTVPIFNTRVTANSYFPAGLNVAAAAEVKKAVKNIKVGVVGSLSDPDLCEEVIADGKADFVILARQLLIADPQFPNKALKGEVEKIDNCLRCVVCRNNDWCSVNPTDMVFHPETMKIRKADKPKKVVVVGGGIGGMKAAEYACEAGHSVILFEKSGKLGGILNCTDNDRFKTDVCRYKNSMAARVQGMDIDIRLNCEAVPDLISGEKPDAVIIATGGRYTPLPVPGGDGENVLDPVTSYLEPEKVGNTIAIVGAGLTGCEAAIHWADKGRKVILISRSKELMRKVTPRNPADGSADTHLIWLDKLQIETYKGYACTEITGEGVHASGDEGDVFIKADTVINAAGLVSDPEGIAAFDETAPVVKAIGDCTNPANIGDAVLAAREAVLAF